MKKHGRLILALTALCEILWIAKLLMDVAYQSYTSPAIRTLFLVLDVIGAVMWVVIFLVHLKAYRAEKDE